MKREELQKMKVAELKAICKENHIPHYNGKNCFKKDELIEAILKAEIAEDVDTSVGDNSGQVSNRIDMEQKMLYIADAKVDTIVAFRLPNGKVKSAKIVRKSTANRKFKVETSYGAQYVVNYDDIVWVRTGRRWPKGVYKLLKGLVEDNGTKG